MAKKKVNKIIDPPPDEFKEVKVTEEPEVKPEPVKKPKKETAVDEPEVEIFMKNNFFHAELPPFWQHKRYMVKESDLAKIPQAYYVFTQKRG